ncbi:hypothetical protein QE152_g33315 [Popillia japonica]|uniref:Uncharacterized protein n=1 Tax=Popillia japonica TaxID=7064 RepID=A0AAW1IWQ6_POPJA
MSQPNLADQRLFLKDLLKTSPIQEYIVNKSRGHILEASNTYVNTTVLVNNLTRTIWKYRTVVGKKSPGQHYGATYSTLEVIKQSASEMESKAKTLDNSDPVRFYGPRRWDILQISKP